MKRRLFSALLCMLLTVSFLCSVTVTTEATELNPENAPLSSGTDLAKGSIYTELGSILGGITIYQDNNSIPLSLTGYRTDTTQESDGSVVNDMVLRLNGEFRRDSSDLSDAVLHCKYSLTSSLLPSQYNGGWMYVFECGGTPYAYEYSADELSQVYSNPDYYGKDLQIGTYQSEFDQKYVQCEDWSYFDPESSKIAYSEMPAQTDLTHAPFNISVSDEKGYRIILTAYTKGYYRYDDENIKCSYTDKITIDITLASGDSSAVVVGNTDAEKSGGIETWILIPAAVIAIIGGIAIVAGKNRKKDKKGNKQKAEEPQQKQPDKDEKEDEPEKTQYAMRIYKEFGDTLTAGGEKLPIYARIVKINAQGKESTDMRMTSMIRISSPEYLQVTDYKGKGEYKGALLYAPEGDIIPDSAVVEFTLQANGGLFEERVHFKINSSFGIEFFQENLTLPAMYDEATMLPFAVEAVDDAVITAVIEPSGGYEAEVEKGEEDGLWYAKIKELSKKEYTPGTVEAFTLNVKLQSGKKEITGSLPLYRFHMGFKVELGPAIECHFELKDEVWMSGGTKLGDAIDYSAKDYQPARTKVTLAVYDWDKEAHEVLVAAVTPGEEDVRFTAIETENQAKLDKMGVRLLYSPDSATENGRNGDFICTEAVLDPPTRFKARLSIHTAFNGKEYTYEQDVLMASQKWRDTKEILENAERDQRVTKYLENLRNSIESGEDLEHLFPLVKYIGIMLEGYSEVYGYDERQVVRVRDIYSRYLSGELLGANAESQTITFADELEMFISAYIDTGIEVEQSLGFWGHLAVGVISMGHAEAIFTTLNAAKKMKEYVSRGGDSAWGAFRVGVTHAFADYIISRAEDAAIGKALKAVKSTGKTAVALAKELSPKTAGSAIDAAEQAVKKTKEYLSEKVGRKIKNVLEKSGDEKGRAKSRAESDILTSNSKPMSPDDIRMEALESKANKAAKVKLDDLESARQVAEKWPTTENKEFYRKKVLAVQQDKAAMYQLKTKAGADKLRKSFNDEMQSIYKNTDERVRQYFESKGTPLKKEVQSATNSSAEALKNGKTVTMDRDVTYYAEDGGLMKQSEVQPVYERAFYEETNGIKPPSDEVAGEWAKLSDQSVVQKASLENYGNQHDLDAMLKNHGEDLINSQKVGTVVSNKGLEWLREGQSLIDKGKLMTDSDLGEKMIEKGLMYRKEGMRQITKQYKYVDARDISKACQSGKLNISEDLRYGIEMFNNTLTDGPTHITVAKCERLLKDKGLTLEDVAIALGKVTTLIG